MASRIKRTSETAAAVESHWSLVTRIVDNWQSVATMIGISGISGYLVWFKQTAIDSPWYDKALFAIFAALGCAFLFSGVRAFWAWTRRSRREEGAIASGFSWSGYTYEQGSIIDGGTHRISEIFGIDQVRSGILFRNCRIEGPGIVALNACHCEKSEFFDLPRFKFIDPSTGAEAAQACQQFLRCRFENCSFSKMLIIGNLNISGPDIVLYRLIES